MKKDDESKMTCEELLFLSKVSESIERHSDMAFYIKKFFEVNDQPFLQQHFELASQAYRSLILPRRSALRILKGQENTDLINDYSRKIEEELKSIIKDFLYILEPFPRSNFGFDFQVHIFKLKSQFNGYLSEIQTGNEQTNSKEKNEYFEKKAKEIIEKEVNPADPLKLGMMLSQATFLCEVMNNKQVAIEIATKAFVEALDKIEELEEEKYKDSVNIMQLLKDNLAAWKENQIE